MTHLLHFSSLPLKLLSDVQRLSDRVMLIILSAKKCNAYHSGGLSFRNQDRRRTKTGTNHNPDPNRYRIRCPDPIARIHEALS